MRMLILCGLKLLVLTLWFILRFFIKKIIENALKANKQTKHPFFLLTCPQ